MPTAIPYRDKQMDKERKYPIGHIAAFIRYRIIGRKLNGPITLKNECQKYQRGKNRE
jgi:hypothetical protein